MKKLQKFYNNLKLTEIKIWKSLKEGVKDRKSFFHTPVLGTLNKNNKVSMRTLVLRGVIRNKLCIRFHTDIRSGKANEIINNGYSTVHFYDPNQKIQILLYGLSNICNDTKSITSIWDKMNISSKACYRLLSKPGEKIQNTSEGNYPGSTDPLEGKKNFSVIHFKISKLEWLYLSSKGHRRCIYDYSGKIMNANWLAP